MRVDSPCSNKMPNFSHQEKKHMLLFQRYEPEYTDNVNGIHV